MKKLIACLLLVLGGVPIYSQIKWTSNANIAAGYEENIFKLPNTFINQDGELLNRAELQSSGITNALGFDISGSKNWKNQSLNFGIDSDAKLYPGQFVHNLYRVQLDQSYQWKLNKQWRVYQNSSWLLNHRSGEDIGVDLFSLPLAYHQWKVLGGVQYKPSKNFYSKLELGRRWKNFRPGETSSLRYQANSVRVFARKSILSIDHIDYIEANIKAESRNYLRESYTSEEEILEEIDLEDEEEFDWEEWADFEERTFQTFALNAQFGIKVSLNQQLYLKPSIELSARNSSNNNLAYRQFKPGIQLVFDQDETILRLRTSYSLRKYTHLIPGNATDYLAYQYFNVQLSGAHPIAKSTFVTLTLKNTTRVSNFNLLTSRLNRSYRTGIALVGIKYAPN